MLRRPAILALALALALALTATASAGEPLATNPPAVPPIDGDSPVVLASGDVLPEMPDVLEHPGVQGEMLRLHDLVPVTPADFATQSLPAPPTDASVGRPVVQATAASVRSAGPQTGTGLGALPNGLQKQVFGFLPYWMLGDADLQWLRYDLVSTIAYFGVAARADGTLATDSNGWVGWTSPAITSVISAAHARGVKVVLTITMMAWDGGAAQATLLGDGAARARLVNAIVAAVRTRGADGVNLDFEPVYTPQRDQYTSFVRQLKAGLSAAGVGSYLTVCTMAGAATWATGYDLAALVAPGASDAVFVMGYDYSWSGSARAGGVAPMESPYMLDINQSVDDYLKIISGAKIIWGVPYYGRAWRTTSDALNASTQPGAASSSVAYYYTGNQVLQARYGRRWDSVGQVPWFAYYDSGAGSWVEGYYDDAQSLGVKWDMVNQRGLAGTGMWTLLMDRGSADLWNVLASKFMTDTTPPTGGITSLPPLIDRSAIPVSWRAFDPGSGVASYSVQVRDRAGGSWTPWLTDVSWTNATYHGVEGHAYEFRVSARDGLGNQQPLLSEALEPGGTIAVGGFARVMTDALNVRSGAGTGYAVLDQVTAGARVAVLSGPVSADGYQWYRVQFAFTEWASADYPRYGWVAAGPTGDPYLVPAPAPTVTFLNPLIRGYGVDPRRISPNGDGADDGVLVHYDLASAVSGMQLDVLSSSGQVVATQTLGPQAAGPSTATWDGRRGNGSWAPDDRYLIRLTATDAAGSHVAPMDYPDADALAAWGVVASVSPPGATYVPLAPSRLLDTRFGNGLAGSFRAGVPRTFQVTGRGGVPLAAVAVTGTLAVTNQTAAGYVSLGPDPLASPTTSTLNAPRGDTRATGVTVILGPGGTLSATFSPAGGATTDLVFDVTGYFVPDGSGATYVPLAPSRLLDTRFGNGLAGSFRAGVPRTFQVTGRGGVPLAAVAVTGTLAVTNQTAAGYVSLGPDPLASPTTSTLNAPRGDTRATGVTVILGPGGTLSATFSPAGGATTDLVFDVTGYFVPDGSGATYVPLAPSRLLDTRFGNGLAGSFRAGVPRTFQVTGRGGVPLAAVAVTGTLAVTNQTAAGYVSLGPDPLASPTTSTLNAPRGDTRATGVTVILGPGGTLSATFSPAGGATTDLVFDVTGYFVP